MALLLCPPAVAQHRANSSSQFLAQAVDRGGVGTGAWELLRQPMNLPNLPMYTGKAHFIKGLMYPNKPGGAAIELHYVVTEDPQSVMSWYSGALDSYQWKSKKAHNECLIRATRGDNGVVVKVTPTRKKGYRSELQISYKLNSSQ